MYYFNQPIDNLLRRIESITFDHHFNQSLNNLSCGIKQIILKKMENLINFWIKINYQKDYW